MAGEKKQGGDDDDNSEEEEGEDGAGASGTGINLTTKRLTELATNAVEKFSLRALKELLSACVEERGV